MSAVSSSDARLRALLEAGLALASELSLDALLHRLVEAAAEITAARYAALGVIDPGGSHLERAAHIDIVAIDKTGTLTVGKPSLTEIVTTSGVHPLSDKLPGPIDELD